MMLFMKQGRGMVRNVKKTGILFAVLAISFGLSVTAMAASVNKTVQLTSGKASTVELGKQVSDILVANPAIADVGTLRANRLYIVGKAVGDTNVLAFDGDGNQLADIAVHVRVDQNTLSDAIKEFFPEEKVNVRTVNNNIVLMGTVSTPLMANRVRDLASRFVTGEGQTVVDLMGVEGEQQVMVKVKVIEAKRSILREYGIETDYKPGNVGSITNANVNTIAGTGLQALAPFASGQLFFDDNGKFGPLKIALQALERDGLVNTLAEPNLTAISGETAGFLAGGEFPVPSGTDDEGNITIEFKQFGVSLNFTPTVLSKDNISLHLATEVSSLSQDDGVTFVGVDIPGLSVRRAETTVEMASGGTIMIAGLIQSDTVNSLNGLPGLIDVPILGDLFKSKSFRRDESELIVLVTPYLVKPFAQQNAQVVTDAGYSARPITPESVAPVAPVTVNPPAGSKVSGTKVSGSSSAVHLDTYAAPALEPQPAGKVDAQALAAPDSTRQLARVDQAPRPLSKKFLDNLQRTYGSRMDGKVHAGSSGYGYIVD